MPPSADHDINKVLKQIGDTYYGYSLVEGKRFPAFKFKDLNSNIYNTQNTKGKIIVLKGWFISCVPCVAEMPALNKLKDEYRDRKDIIFLGMAFDRKDALQRFLKTHTFNYAVVPVTAKYLHQTLHVTGYPVHWVINKQGIVVDMSYDMHEMIAALRAEAAKTP